MTEQWTLKVCGNNPKNPPLALCEFRFADIERHCKTQSFAGFEFTVEMWLEHFKKQVLETYQHCKEIDSAPAERK